MAVQRFYEQVFKDYPELLKQICTAPERYNEMVEEILALESQGRVFVIRPEEPITIGRMEKDKEKLRALYREGRRVGKKQWKALSEYLARS